MFVIMQCWDNLFSNGDKATKEIPLAKRIGKTMKHAGVAITVTSATDMVAFAVGSVTVSVQKEREDMQGKKLVSHNRKEAVCAVRTKRGSQKCPGSELNQHIWNFWNF